MISAVCCSAAFMKRVTRCMNRDYRNQNTDCLQESSLRLGIHESQSRLWENHVGRSRSFWKFNYPLVTEKFQEAFRGISEGQFYKAINKVKPSLIRTESDQLRHFHVMIRYEIKKCSSAAICRQMISPPAGKRNVGNGWMWMCPMMKGDVCRMFTGVMADFGYFPTSSLGSFYAAPVFCAGGEGESGFKRKNGKRGNNGTFAMAQATNPWIRPYLEQ